MAVRRVFGPSTESEAASQLVLTHKVPRHRDEKGLPKFSVSFYAVDARGRTAGASIWSGSKHVVGDSVGVRTVESAWLYKKGT